MSDEDLDNPQDGADGKRKLTYGLVGLFGGGAVGAIAGLVVSGGLIITAAAAVVGIIFYVCGSFKM